MQLADTRDSPAPIPLLAAALGADSRSVLLAYGNHLQPVMERAVSTDRAQSVMAVRKKPLAGYRDSVVRAEQHTARNKTHSF